MFYFTLYLEDHPDLISEPALFYLPANPLKINYDNILYITKFHKICWLLVHATGDHRQ